MNLHLTNKIAIVLAASKGLGKAIATSLSSEGAKVIIASRDAEELNKTAAEISAQTGNEVIAMTVDVSNGESIQSLVQQVAAKFGHIDILVNNAGGPPFNKFENFDDEAWQKAFDLNLLSVARTSRLVLPHMQKTGSGRIINIISSSVKAVLGNSVLSTSMRMGVVGMAKLMADEFGPYNITVNNVAPGYTLTERQEELATARAAATGKPKEEMIGLWAAQVPMRRLASAEEIGAAVAFLASERASYITGVTLQVDGGWVRSLL